MNTTDNTTTEKEFLQKLILEKFGVPDERQLGYKLRSLNLWYGTFLDLLINRQDVLKHKYGSVEGFIKQVKHDLFMAKAHPDRVFSSELITEDYFIEYDWVRPIQLFYDEGYHKKYLTPEKKANKKVGKKEAMLFCHILIETGIERRGKDEPSIKLLPRLCEKYELDYTDKVRTNYSQITDKDQEIRERRKKLIDLAEERCTIFKKGYKDKFIEQVKNL